MTLKLTGDIELQRLFEDLKSEGKKGKAIFRKGLRAGTKVIAKQVKASFPRKTGVAAESVKVKSMKRKKGRVGLRVSLFALSTKNYPYPLAIEYGAKPRPANLGTISRRSKAGQRIYANVAYRIQPKHPVERAFEQAAPQAQIAILETCAAELEKVRARG